MKPNARFQETFDGRVAVVTGAGSGIGRELALLLRDSGARVHACDRNEGAIRPLAETPSAPGSITPHVLDVADGRAVTSVFRRIEEEEGRIDFLFNNAGITLLGESHLLSFDLWKSLLDINLMGVVHGIQAVYPSMVRQGRGHIINTASVAAVTGYATSVAYAGSKAAILELSRSLGSEAEGHGVRVSAACPGYVNSGIFSQERIVGSDRDHVVGNLPVAMLPPRTAARMLLEGVVRKQREIIFPTTARMFCFLGRWFPFLLAPSQKKLIRVFREGGGIAARD
ncbi:MAG: SDR family oxidoreductase [Akkermansiaceae bacterium]|nr:SDR family oxidoreductase [Akkermansiaceae bacterium]MCP5542654.1 SDR family oxidoreductase [Akkermansiaceae bacterium]MCP5548233.1 SDR family oxidoreductase [Akkermansiaceae bacterium]